MINQYFGREEFACSCGCGFDAVDKILLDVLTETREHFNAPLTITSGCRCESHNKTIGGAKKSYHVRGKAADIKVKGFDAMSVYKFLDNHYQDRLGVILYPTWVHIDVRDNAYRGESL